MVANSYLGLCVVARVLLCRKLMSLIKCGSGCFYPIGVLWVVIKALLYNSYDVISDCWDVVVVVFLFCFA